MNVLFLATYGDFLATFELSNIRLWMELGCTVHCASDFTTEKYNLKTKRLDDIGVKKHNLKFTRNPLDKSNLRTYRQLLTIIREEKIEIIDCHNAVVGVYSRLAAAKCNVRTVIYTPHSFFFYKGCPAKNKFLYKNVESIMARKTDLLITINQEDYISAQKMKMRGKAVFIPGIGIDTKAITALPERRIEYRREFGVPDDAYIYLSVGELISRKNHETAIKAFAELKQKNAYYFICGIGELDEYLKKIIDELGLSSRVKLLGYRLDAKEIMKASDVFFFPSFQEGLPVALMEAMASGLPCIVSRIRGNVDLIEENDGGVFFDPTSVDSAVHALLSFTQIDKAVLIKWKERNKKKVKEYDITIVRDLMRKEYSELLTNANNQLVRR